MELNTGARIPALGFGTFSWEDTQELGKLVEHAIETGYRHLDCAYLYKNEKVIGKVLQRCFEAGTVKREDLFMTSKLWCSFHSKDLVLRGCRETLSNLQLDCLDLFLIHWPITFKEGANDLNAPDDAKLGYSAERMAEVWEAMEELVDKGFVKAIGISNFSITKTERLLKTAKIVPAVNQIEWHPYLQQPKLVEYCKSKGIVVEAYSPLGRPGNPDVADMPAVINDPVVTRIAAKHSATPAQVLLAFGIAHGLVVLPKTKTLSRMSENLGATNIALDSADIAEMRELDRNLRYVLGKLFLKETESLDVLWDLEDEAFVLEGYEPAAKKSKKN